MTLKNKNHKKTKISATRAPKRRADKKKSAKPVLLVPHSTTSTPKSLGNVRQADPYLEREKAKYASPLPSREYVQSFLAEAGVPLSTEVLIERLEIMDVEREGFLNRLRAMERAGQIMRNRRGDYLLPDKLDLIRGRVEGHPDGYGFLIRDDKGADIFLSPKEMRTLMHGDRAIVRISGQDRKGRPEGTLVEILERANSRVVGRVLEEHGVQIVVPENRRITHDIVLAPSQTKVKAGQVVTVELIEQPGKHAQAIGKVVEILGNYADPGMEIEIALRKYDLPFEFPPEVLAQTQKLPDSVLSSDWTPGREDIRHLPLVTIDGETARDFDDAVYCEPRGKGYRLVVAIADVSAYVPPGSPLDQSAYDRGNSVYFPRRVIPMLPEKLSNGLCSLNPHVERLCMVCDMVVSAQGEISQYRFYPAVMYSHARLTYTQVAAALYEPKTSAGKAARTLIGELLKPLKHLEKLFRILLKARAQRGAIDFESTETRMIFDDQGKIERIVPETRNDAHRIIEECMLAANVCTADFLMQNNQPALYRVHEGPTPERLAKLRAFLSAFGLELTGGDDPQASDYAALLNTIKARPDAALFQTVMLRSLQQAVYSPENAGHFGLSYPAYTHFTSPIRRYPDLLVHRAIKAVLAKVQYRPGDWAALGEHCSMTERRADEATRDVIAWLKCYYMQDKVGEIYTGRIAAVVPFGVFVLLEEVFIEGLIHISDLGTDYFRYDDVHHQLLGERTGKRFRLSDRVKIQVVRVDMQSNKIDFRLIAGPLKEEVEIGPASAPTAAKASPSTQTPSPENRTSKPKAPKTQKRALESTPLAPSISTSPKTQAKPRKSVSPSTKVAASTESMRIQTKVKAKGKGKGKGKPTPKTPIPPTDKPAKTVKKTPEPESSNIPLVKAKPKTRAKTVKSRTVSSKTTKKTEPS